ncbi:hypothetical protein K458DRAFT_29319 [Lentithecium fluviatile CBS 122367]|uniref:Uncharacterized protein n=1 Tax=Lentithecium fluviatile CBS 122367 TaxID=1168545 RepID=A0A6G1J393_9PLEO|nr:hypothetical protein K458DRAFT_29319 [Lentithecium fluviatile CBS 122367]
MGEANSGRSPWMLRLHFGRMDRVDRSLMPTEMFVHKPPQRCALKALQCIHTFIPAPFLYITNTNLPTTFALQSLPRVNMASLLYFAFMHRNQRSLEVDRPPIRVTDDRPGTQAQSRLNAQHSTYHAGHSHAVRSTEEVGVAVPMTAEYGVSTHVYYYTQQTRSCPPNFSRALGSHIGAAVPLTPTDAGVDQIVQGDGQQRRIVNFSR